MFLAMSVGSGPLIYKAFSPFILFFNLRVMFVVFCCTTAVGAMLSRLSVHCVYSSDGNKF